MASFASSATTGGACKPPRPMSKIKLENKIPPQQHQSSFSVLETRNHGSAKWQVMDIIQRGKDHKEVVIEMESVSDEDDTDSSNQKIVKRK